MTRHSYEIKIIGTLGPATQEAFADLVVEAKLMSREEVMRLLSPARLSGLEAITTSIPIVEAEAIEAAEKSRE